MSSTERDLADVAHWKVIQKKTFTQWANKHLKQVNEFIKDLDFDLHDGVRLSALVEVLSGKKLPKYNRRPSSENQMLENVSICLDFLQIEEGIKLVNIDSSDIVSCNSKAILHLMETLILHYSISMPMWDGLENSSTWQTPRQKLLWWIRSRIRDKPIRNFTTDWNDGTAIGALVDAVAPGLCPHWRKWDPKNNVANAKKAMEVAKRDLGVPKLIKPVEMCSPTVDEMSMMTYLSQFPSSIMTYQSQVSSSNMKQVVLWGQGTNSFRSVVNGQGMDRLICEPGSDLISAVQTFNRGRQYHGFRVFNPHWARKPIQALNPVVSGQSIYVPMIPAKYTQFVKYVQITAEGRPDASRVTVCGPGIERYGSVVRQTATFYVFTKNAGNGVVNVMIVDPAGLQDTVRQMVNKHSVESVWSVRYSPNAEGLHKVYVLFAGRPIPGSPFSVFVSSAIDARKCYVTGRGIQLKGVRVDDLCDFTVHTENAGGEAEVMAKVVGSGGFEENLTLKRFDPKTYEYSYVPKRTGRYVVSITYGGQGVAGSPFRVDVGPKKDSKIRAFGPGLQHGIVGYPACFTVIANGETGVLGFSIKGPSQAKIDCKDNGDGSADIFYWPTAPGKYAVHILCNEEDIPRSPYMVDVSPSTTKFDPTKVEVHGQGILKTGVTVSKWAEFVVDARRAGHAPLHVVASEVDYFPVDVVVKDNNDGTYNCRYMPRRGVKHVVVISYGNVAVPNSPFRVLVQEASRVKVFGPALDRPVMVHQPTHLIVDCSEAGPGDVAIALTNERGINVPVKTTETRDSTFRIDFEASRTGMYSACIYFGGHEIPNSPYKIQVLPDVPIPGPEYTIKAHKCYVTGRGIQPKGVRVDDLCDFTVHTENAGGEAEVMAKVVGSGGTEEKLTLKRLDPKTYEYSYVPKRTGVYVVSITYGGQGVALSPFRVDVGPKKDSKIRAYGPGLQYGIVGYPACFTVDTNGETGALGFSIGGPSKTSKTKIVRKDNGHGSTDISYWPTASGEYAVHILCNEEDIPRSPYMVDVSPSTTKFDPTKVEVHGLKTEVTVSKWAEFVVDARRAGHAPLHVVATEVDYFPVEVVVKDNKDGTYNCRYMPRRGVEHVVVISYGNVAVPNSPFRVLVREASNPSRVEVFGPARDRPVMVHQPTHLIVDCSEAGPGDVVIVLKNESGIDLNVRKTKTSDQSFQFDFEATTPGEHKAHVYFADEEIPSSPYKVNVVRTPVDVTKIIILGLKEEVYIESVIDFTIDPRALGSQGHAKIKVILTDPARNQSEVVIRPTWKEDGTLDGIYKPQQKGPHILEITYDGTVVPPTPFHFCVLDSDPGRVRAFGPGLEGGIMNQPQRFTVETKGAGVGRLGLAIDGPSEAKLNCSENRNGSCNVEYLPTESGSYVIVIKFAEKPIPGSPFHVEIADDNNPQKVRCYGPGVESKGVRKGQPGNFTIDASQAGTATPEVSATDLRGRNRPGQVKPRGNGLFDATYFLDVEGPSKVDVTFAGRAVPGSPFTSRILPPYDATKVHVTGEGVKPKGVTASLPTTFLMDTRDAGLADHDVIILDPAGGLVRSKIVNKGDDTFVVTYTPCDVGRFTIQIKYGGDPVPLSPFYVMTSATGDASKVKINDRIKSVVEVGQKCIITLDISFAGYGNVTCNINSPFGSDVNIDIIDNHNGTVSVDYFPRLPGVYVINLKFGGQPIPKGQFSQKALTEPEKPDPKPLDFVIPAGPSFSLVSAEVLTPSGKKDMPRLEDNRGGMVAIVYTPSELGLHRLVVRYNKVPVYGSPFHFYVYSLHSGDVSAFGQGLSHGIIDQRCHFTIDCKDAGADGLSCDCYSPVSKLNIDKVHKKDGTCSVSYLPKVVGEYIIVIKQNGKHINGSPFTAKIMPPVVDVLKTPLTQMLIFWEVVLTSIDIDVGLLAIIRSPFGREELCTIKRFANGQYGILFVPREVGDYFVSVFRHDKHIPNSPFPITVSESHIGNAAQVKASGKGLTTGSSNDISEFYVNTKNAGYGRLSILIEGSRVRELDCRDDGNSICHVKYRPTEPGTCIINIRFADEHIPGSPFHVKVNPPEILVTRGTIDCELSLRIQDARRGDVKVLVTPELPVLPIVTVYDQHDTVYNCSIRFTPTKDVHTIHVQHKGLPVPGSPFRFIPIIEGEDEVRRRRSGQGDILPLWRDVQDTTTTNSSSEIYEIRSYRSTYNCSERKESALTSASSRFFGDQDLQISS